jgi:septum formation protein
MTVWRQPQPLILASQSRARQTILANAGIEYQAIPAALDERAVQKQSGLRRAADVASLLALEKARAVAATHRGRIVLGADQTLALEAKLFDKPAGRIEAAEQLRSLSGKTHELHSAIALIGDGELIAQGVSLARMTMRLLTEHAIERYLDVAGDAVTTSVGAYQFEGLGVHLFERVEGDHFTILGLPLLILLPILREKALIDI